MPSNNAKTPKFKSDLNNVVFVVYPGIKLLDLAGPLQVFSDALAANGKPAYRAVVVSLDGVSVQSDTCVSVDCDSIVNWKRRKIDTLILVGGKGVFNAIENQPLKKAITGLAFRSRRVGSICNAAFLLAEYGLLNGRRATTHWESTHKLAADYPNVQVEEDSIFVQDESTWTSAGVTAGIDMALAMVTEDLGREAALSLARSLVTFFIRPGGQSQFSEALELQATDAKSRFDELHKWIQANLDKDLRVEHMADKANMSSRHFSRVYQAETGRTPAKAVEAVRVEAARRLLEDGASSVAMVAQRCGFGDAERMRRAFIRIHKVPPTTFTPS